MSEAPREAQARLVLQAARRHVWLAAPEGAERVRVRGGVDLVPGDRALLDPDGVVSRRLERRTLLARRVPRNVQVLAANVDDLAVVTAVGPRASGEGLIARTLAAAHASGIQPLIVLNKIDLDHAGDGLARITRWRTLGFEALAVSAKTGEGLEVLRARFTDRAVALVGASGVGKSHLVNALVPEANLRVGAVDARGYGRHTTTLARAVRWASGLLVDLPGVRSFGLVDDAGLAYAFPEIVEHAARCRFFDCRHRTEPDCAVRDAALAGEIDPERLEAYQSIRESIARGAEGLRKR